MREKARVSSINQNFFKNKISLLDRKTSNSVVSQNDKSPYTPYLLILALSIHACFEGIALGLQKNGTQIFYMLVAISLHKWVEALSIGINLFKSKIERNMHFKFILIFSIMTPLGILFGMLFSGISEVIESIFISISAGYY